MIFDSRFSILDCGVAASPNMIGPKFKLGDRVRVTEGHDLEGRVGVISDPDPLRRTKPRWPDTYWKSDSRRVTYWIEFAAPGTTPGDLCAAEVDEEHLVPA